MGRKTQPLDLDSEARSLKQCDEDARREIMRSLFIGTGWYDVKGLEITLRLSGYKNEQRQEIMRGLLIAGVGGASGQALYQFLTWCVENYPAGYEAVWQFIESVRSILVSTFGAPEWVAHSALEKVHVRDHQWATIVEALSTYAQEKNATIIYNDKSKFIFLERKTDT